MLSFVLAATIISLAIVWTVQALGKINVVTDTGQSITTFLTLAFFLLPSVVPIVVPFAVLIGVIQTLSTMNTDSELAVIAASGATRSAVFRPALLLAFGAAFLFSSTIIFLNPIHGKQSEAWSRKPIPTSCHSQSKKVPSSVLKTKSMCRFPARHQTAKSKAYLSPIRAILTWT